MNRTPFALFTLLCTLATSMVAAGNASRRAVVDHAQTKLGGSELAMTGFLIVLEDRREPVREASWMPVDLDRLRADLQAQLSAAVNYVQAVEAKRIAAAKPTFVKRSPTPSVVLSWFDTAETAAWLKRARSFDVYRLGSPVAASAGQRAATQPRVTSKVAASPRFELPAGSPLRSAGVVEVAARQWAAAPAVRVVSPAGLPVQAAVAMPSRAKLTIGSLHRGGQPLVVPGIATSQGYWTPSLHLADDAKSLLGSYYAAPEAVARPTTVKVRKAGGWKTVSQKLGLWLETLPAAREAAVEGYLAALGFGESAGEPIRSAGRPSGTQK